MPRKGSWFIFYASINFFFFAFHAGKTATFLFVISRPVFWGAQHRAWFARLFFLLPLSGPWFTRFYPVDVRSMPRHSFLFLFVVALSLPLTKPTYSLMGLEQKAPDSSFFWPLIDIFSFFQRFPKRTPDVQAIFQAKLRAPDSPIFFSAKWPLIDLSFLGARFRKRTPDLP